MPKIDDHIQRAMQEGKFDDLPGKGKPLRLEENPYEDPDWRLAHHMLQSSGYTLPWIELRQEIEAQTEKARLELQRAWEWRQAGPAQNLPYQQAEGEWQRAVEGFRQQVEKINKQIFDYNLQVPSSSFQLLKLDADKEVAAVRVD
jgi:DnaJ family protein C protein 28